MPVPLVVAGTTYQYPLPGEVNWGQQATLWAQAVTNNLIPKSGGLFSLTGDLNFGPTNGLIVAYLINSVANPAQTGVVRLSNNTTISWRNAANTADLPLSVNSSGQLTFNNIVLSSSTLGPVLNAGGAPSILEDITANRPSPSIPGRLFVDTTLNQLQRDTGSSWVSIVGAGSGTVTSVDASGGTTGMSFSGGPITSSGTLTLAGTLAIANGGTGQTTKLLAFNALSPTTTKGDIIINDGTNNVRLAVGSTGQFLQVGASSALQWNSITYALSGGTTGFTWSPSSASAPGTTFTMAGTLAIANGGTGQTTAGAAFNALSPVTSTGDLILGNGTNSSTRLAIGTSAYVLTSNGTTASWQPASGSSPLTTKGDVYTFSTVNARLGVGTNGQVLTADSTQTTGIKWATPTSGSVSSVDVSGGTTGLTTSGGPITSSGTITLAGTLAAANGGTGQTTYTLGDTLYSSAANTLSKLAGNITSTKQFLSQTGTGTVSAAPVWSVVTSTDVGLGNVTNDAQVKLSTFTTKGDIIAASASATIGRLGVGTNGQILTADSTQTLGVKWATSSAGTVTSIDVSGGTTGLTTSGGPVTSSGTITLAGTLATTNGGTGLTSFTANGAVYATSTSALTTGTLPINAGGTSANTKAGAFSALSPVTSTGDLIIGNGVNSTTRLAIGTNGQVLTSNGTTATWAAAGGSSPALSPLGPVVVQEDFASGRSNASQSAGQSGQFGLFTGKGTGGGQVFDIAGETSHPGITRLVGGLTGGDSAVLILSNVSTQTPIIIDDINTLYFIVRPGTFLSTNIRIGMASAFSSIAPSNAVWFGISGTNWFAYSRGAGTQSGTSTGVAVSLATWYELKIIRVGSAQYDFYVNGSYTVSATTNVPAGGTAINVGCLNIDVAGSSTLDVDYIGYQTNTFTARH